MQQLKSPLCHAHCNRTGRNGILLPCIAFTSTASTQKHHPAPKRAPASPGPCARTCDKETGDDERSYCLQKFMRGLAMYSSSDIRTTHLLLHKVDQVRGKHVCAVHIVDTIHLLGHERGCLRCARGSHVSCCNTHSVGVPRSHTAHKEHRRTYCSVGRHFLRLVSCQIPCSVSTVCLPQHCGHYSVHYLYVWHDLILWDMHPCKRALRSQRSQLAYIAIATKGWQ